MLVRESVDSGAVIRVCILLRGIVYAKARCARIQALVAKPLSGFKHKKREFPPRRSSIVRVLQ